MATVPEYQKHMIPTMQDMLHNHLSPNTETFKALMAFYHNTRNEEKLKEMWEKMDERGVLHTAETCFYLIDMLARKLDMSGAITYYEKYLNKKKCVFMF